MLVYTALLVAAAAGSALAAPSPLAVDATLRRSPEDGGVTVLPLTKRASPVSRRDHPDPAVRFAWTLDQRLHTRMKYSRFLDAEGREKLERDIEARFNDDARLRKRDSIPLNGWGRDWEYTVAVEIGTPAQTFEVQVDTGSGDLWVFDQCTNDTECGGVPLYDPTKSSTYTSSNTKYDIQYAIGSSTGMWGFDTVSLGGYTMQKQAFGLVDQSDAWYGQGTNLTGLMGFSWSGAASVSTVTPFWQELAPSWTDPVFSMYLQRETTTAYDDSDPTVVTSYGSMMLGGTDKNLYQGDINYIAMAVDGTTMPAFWNVAIQGITVLGKALNANMTVQTPEGVVSGQPLAAIDSGTTLMYGPSDMVEEIYSNIPGSIEVAEGVYFYPCDNGITEVGLTFRFGGVDYPIDDTDLAQTLWTTDEAIAAGAFARSPGSTKMWCQGSLQGQEVEPNMPPWLLGDAFMKNVYSVFSYSPPAVGFATLSPAADKKMSASDATAPASHSGVTGQPVPGPAATGTTGGSSPSGTSAACGLHANAAVAALVAAAAMAAML